MRPCSTRPTSSYSANNFAAGLTSASITDTGALTVSGATNLAASTTVASLILSTPLTVPNGGTGLTAVPAVSVLYGQGGPILGAATAPSAGLCLLSGATDVQWGSCSGAVPGVATLDNLSGLLSIANSTGVGTTITINNAKADGATKGIVTFNATNFSDNGSGTVNTIQNIANTSTPTFAGLNTNTITPSAAFTLGAAGQQFTLQGSNASTIVASNGANTTTLGFRQSHRQRYLSAPSGCRRHLPGLHYHRQLPGRRLRRRQYRAI